MKVIDQKIIFGSCITTFNKTKIMNKRKVKKETYRIRLTKPSDKFVYVSESLIYERRKKEGKRCYTLYVKYMNVKYLCVSRKQAKNLIKGFMLIWE